MCMYANVRTRTYVRERTYANVCTEVPELQDVVGLKSTATPLQPKPVSNWIKFFAEAPREDTFRGIEGIFEFRLRS